MGKTRLLTTILALVLLCAGCGGSGGGGGSDNNSTKSEETYAISGQVKMGGVGLAGVTVTLSGAGSAETTTDFTGSFCFSNLPNGEYVVTPSLTEFVFTPVSAHVTVAGCVVIQNFTAMTDGISGQVTLGGTAIAGVTVTLSGAVSARTVTDSTGSYSFTSLENGNYTVTPSLARCAFTPIDAQVAYTGGNLTRSFTALVNPDIAAGFGHSLALKSDGTVWAWGDNYYGQLGDGTYTNRYTPVEVTILTGVIAIAAGSSHSLALKSDGTVWSWGYNRHGQLGNGGDSSFNPVPLRVTGLSSAVSAIAAGSYHSLALTSSGGVKAWGDNQGGQLGNNSTVRSLVPIDVSGLTSGVIAIATKNGHSLALTSGGGIKAWGGNAQGQLGDGTTTTRLTPVDVAGLTSGVTDIAAENFSSLALMNNGGIKAWGYNRDGQLGDGSTTDRSTPVDVSGLTSGVIAITAGGSHSLALMNGGGVKTWGYNYYGQLGDGTTTTRLNPVDVSGLTSGVIAIAAGEFHSLALMNNGSVKTWGDNYCGQLGDGTTTDRLTPVDVVGLSNMIVPVYVIGLSGGSSNSNWVYIGGNTSGSFVQIFAH